MNERILVNIYISSVVTLDVLGGHVPIPAEELSVLLLYLAAEYRTSCEVRETCVAEHYWCANTLWFFLNYFLRFRDRSTVNH